MDHHEVLEWSPTILKESAIQKPTKFHAPHCRLSGSTKTNMNCLSLHRCLDTRDHTRFQIMIRQHQLGVGEARLTFHRKLPRIVPELRRTCLFHDCFVKMETSAEKRMKRGWRKINRFSRRGGCSRGVVVRVWCKARCRCSGE